MLWVLVIACRWTILNRKGEFRTKCSFNQADVKTYFYYVFVLAKKKKKFAYSRRIIQWVWKVYTPLFLTRTTQTRLNIFYLFFATQYPEQCGLDSSEASGRRRNRGRILLPKERGGNWHIWCEVVNADVIGLEPIIRSLTCDISAHLGAFADKHKQMQRCTSTRQFGGRWEVMDSDSSASERSTREEKMEERFRQKLAENLSFHLAHQPF